MINDKIKKQEGGEGSSNIQAEKITVYNGLSYRDVKEIASELFDSNFLRLKEEAAKIAGERAEEITNKILVKLEEEKLDSLVEFTQPAMQDALFAAQKEFAKSGDENLGDLLVDIIVDRAQATERNMLQIVLDESLRIAPKLTVSQMDTLTLLFLLIRTRRMNVNTYVGLISYFNDHVFPFAEGILLEPEHYNYLEYLRCGTIRAGDYGPFEKHLRSTYQGFLCNGFTEDELNQEIDDISGLDGLIIPCFHDNAKLQLGVFDESTLETEMIKRNIPSELQVKIKQFFNKTTKNNQEIKETLIHSDARFEQLFELWNNSRFKKFELSSVGISIANANYRRRTGESMDLSIWIK